VRNSDRIAPDCRFGNTNLPPGKKQHHAFYETLELEITVESLRGLEAMPHYLNSPFGRRSRRRRPPDPDLPVAAWFPPVDILEDENEYFFKAELPGIHPEDIRVSVDHGVLTIRGERRCEHEEKNKKFHRVERAQGFFTRSFALPEDSDAAKVTARFQNGVLHVRLPKNPETVPKTIAVHWVDHRQ
jgi:HSP20 family protein